MTEAYRTLKPGGVLRLSFPGLEGCLKNGYKIIDYPNALRFKMNTYYKFKHAHLYSKQELEVVCKHIGFREVNFVEFGESDYPELKNLETRPNQKHSNTYVELVK